MNDSENYENSFASLFVYNNHLLATEISVLNSVQVCNELHTAMVLFTATATARFSLLAIVCELVETLWTGWGKNWCQTNCLWVAPKPWLYWFIRTQAVGKKVQLVVRKLLEILLTTMFGKISLS